MIPVEEAISIILKQTRPLAAEQINLADALNRVLSENIIADSDLPPFDRAQMDGFALRAEDVKNVPACLRVVGEAVAGCGFAGEISTGEAVRIMTGAPVPASADAVQQVEHTRPANEGKSVDILKSVQPGQFIIKRASEVGRRTEVLQSGEILTAARMAVLASFGYARVSVARRPRVCILATGSELVPVTEKPEADKIRDSNSYSLAAYAQLAGAEVERLPLAGDDPKVLQKIIADAASRSDAIIISGGVSMGDYDFTKPALSALGAEIFFERVRLRPGKPTVFARIGDCLIFGLPGNPVSVSVTFNLFARTAIRFMQGAHDAELIEEQAILERAAKLVPERVSYLPATLQTDETGHLKVEPLRWGGSSDFVAFARATALVIVPAGEGWMEAGALVKIVRLPS
jgi:molybdopterin molybdotransferase